MAIIRRAQIKSGHRWGLDCLYRFVPICSPISALMDLVHKQLTPFVHSFIQSIIHSLVRLIPQHAVHRVTRGQQTSAGGGGGDICKSNWQRLDSGLDNLQYTAEITILFCDTTATTSTTTTTCEYSRMGNLIELELFIHIISVNLHHLRRLAPTTTIYLSMSDAEATRHMSKWTWISGEISWLRHWTRYGLLSIVAT